MAENRQNPGTHRPAEAAKPMPKVMEAGRRPGGQEEPMSEEELLDEALDETFPASDPISPSRIDGPKN